MSLIILAVFVLHHVSLAHRAAKETRQDRLTETSPMKEVEAFETTDGVGRFECCETYGTWQISE